MVMTTLPKPTLAPTPPTHPIKLVLQIRHDPLDLIVKAQQDYGDIVRLQVGPRIVHLISHPDHIQYVLQTNNTNYRKGRGLMRVRPLLGDGLLTNHGDSWLKQRRLAQPAFHRQRLAELAATINDCTACTLAGWQGKAISGETFNAAEDMLHLTLSIVGKALFSTDLGANSEMVGAAMTQVLDQAVQRIINPPFLDHLPLPGNRRFQAAIEDLDKVVFHIIETRHASHEEHHDLLAMLMGARDEDSGEGMNDQQLRDEVMTLFLAGHETTANALSWAWLLLTQHPEVMATLQAELKSVLAGRAPTFGDLPNLPYTRMVIEETMRLYPPAWIIVRDANHDDEIGGYHIPANSGILISPYIMHRHPAYWDAPEDFNPLNFAAEKEHSRWVYFPFGGGPRQCIGSNFAMMEAQLILATLAAEFSPKLAQGQGMETLPSVTLRPRHGVWLRLS